MNYFLTIKHKSNYPLKYGLQNKVNGSWLGVGRFVKENTDAVLIYEDAANSKVSYEDLIRQDVIETVGGGLLISERFKDLITAHFKSDVQMLSTAFTYQGILNSTYVALNVFNKVECYDLDKSAYTKHPVDNSLKFTQTVLQTTPLEEYGFEYNVVRSQEDNKIVVSELFKSLVEAAKINGVGFKK